MSAHTQNAQCQLCPCMMAVISGGATAPPTPTPAKIRPLASPRSCEGIQLATSRLLAGKMMASPMPSAKRTASSSPSAPAMPLGTAGSSAVNTLHHRIAMPMARAAPMRSAMRPASGCDSA